MVAAPVIAFVATHILYLHFYEFDYGMCIYQIPCKISGQTLFLLIIL